MVGGRQLVVGLVADLCSFPAGAEWGGIGMGEVDVV